MSQTHFKPKFQSTHPVWGGTSGRTSPVKLTPISIHPPRVGWDLPLGYILQVSIIFQSTHPVWGGTAGSVGRWGYPGYFNPPTPCGVGPSPAPRTPWTIYFNPPTPCGVGRVDLRSTRGRGYFNPPTPCGVGPFDVIEMGELFAISIHPPRVGWDQKKKRRKARRKISIHPPRVGWDPPPPRPPTKTALFQSTHPVWGGTANIANACNMFYNISNKDK